MIGRILRSADFERVLRMPIRARSPHFALHHLADRPSRPKRASPLSLPELSTAAAPSLGDPVDDLPLARVAGTATTLWLGAVVPKRHARRSVTRSLLKREIRGAVLACRDQLKPGLWVVRLRAPIDRALFPSAVSDALRQAVRSELLAVLAGAAARR